LPEQQGVPPLRAGYWNHHFTRFSCQSLEPKRLRGKVLSAWDLAYKKQKVLYVIDLIGKVLNNNDLEKIISEE
jgi:hypothetical protein